MSKESGQERKLLSLETLEKWIQPTLTHKLVFVLIYIVSVGTQLYLDYSLRTNLSSPIIPADKEVPSVIRCLSISIFFRIAVLALAFGGIFHNRLTPWTFGTTFSFISLLLSAYSLLVSYWHPPVESMGASFFYFYFILYYLSFVFSTLTCGLLSYQVLTLRSQNKFSLNLEDPQEQFADRVLKGFMYILPGSMVFNSMFKVEKRD